MTWEVDALEERKREWEAGRRPAFHLDVRVGRVVRARNVESDMTLEELEAASRHAELMLRLAGFDNSRIRVSQIGEERTSPAAGMWPGRDDGDELEVAR